MALMRLSVFFVVFYTACSLTNSGDRPQRRTNTDADQKNDKPSDQLPPANGGGSQTTESAVHPKILFHGGGGYSALTPGLKDMSSASQQIAKLGFPSKDIFLVTYPDTKNISDIKAALDPQLKKIFAKYDANTRFDAIGHSLGLLAGFVSLSELGHLPKIRSIIGVNGVLMRQEKSAMPAGCSPNNTRDLCGDIFDKVVGSSNSPYIVGLIQQNQTELTRINKCAIWSSNDGILKPANSGVFPDGKSVEMTGNWCKNASLFNPCHLQAKSSPEVFAKMKSDCFNGNWD